MTRIQKAGVPIAKNPRGNPAHDHSPDDRRHSRPTGVAGMDADRKVEKHHGKR